MPTLIIIIIIISNSNAAKGVYQECWIIINNNTTVCISIFWMETPWTLKPQCKKARQFQTEWLYTREQKIKLPHTIARNIDWPGIVYL